MLVALVWESNIWFELAQCLPYKALALMAMAAACESSVAWKPKKRHVQMALGLAVAAMVWSAYDYKKSIRYEIELRDAAHALPYDDYAQSWVESDIRLGGDRLRSSAAFFANWLIHKQKGFGLDDNDRNWYGRFIEAAHNAAASANVGASISALELKLYYSAMVDITDPVFTPLRELVLSNNPMVLLQLAAKAPRRDDMAAAYLQEMEHNDALPLEDRISFLNQLLSIAPEHRGALWVLGGLLRQMQGREAEGLELQKRAVALGVDRVYPLKEDAIASYK